MVTAHYYFLEVLSFPYLFKPQFGLNNAGQSIRDKNWGLLGKWIKILSTLKRKIYLFSD